MRLVLFKDLLEDEAASQYGIVLDGDEPDVICLCCGSTIEFGDYEILQELTWENLSAVLKVRREPTKNKYVVCMDASYLRDVQMFDTSGMTEEEFEFMDRLSDENEWRWHDMSPNPFIGIVEAESEEAACYIAAEKYRYDSRCLYATKI